MLTRPIISKTIEAKNNEWNEPKTNVVNEIQTMKTKIIKEPNSNESKIREA